MFNKRAILYSLSCSFLILNSFVCPIHASASNIDVTSPLSLSTTTQKDKTSEQNGKRVLQDELQLFNEKESSNSNLNALTSNVVSKEDFELCGLKGTMQVEDNKYYITYTSDNNFIVNQVSLMEDINETKYAITNVNVYSELNEESEIIETYGYNESISVIGQYEDWYKVSVNNQIGYMKNNHLANSKLQLKRENQETHIYSNGERVGEDITSISLGTFSLTAYCTCEICCGQWSGYNSTASGTTPKSNHTIAVDTSVIPMGASVVIDGKTYVAEDTGSGIKGNSIDVFMDSHQQALIFGRKYKNVTINVN